MEVAVGGAGGRAPDLRGPELLCDEVDDALLGLECKEGKRVRARIRAKARTILGDAEKLA